MSRSTQCLLTCPCGEAFSSPIYEYVNVARDPHLQYTVLAGLLNVSICPSCSRRAAIARPLIYSDPVHNLLVYAHPHADVPDETRSLILGKLQAVYGNIASDHSTDYQQCVNGGQDGNGAMKPGYINHQLSAPSQQAIKMPPLQVVFGLDELNELINVSLSQDERLGKLALSTHSRSDAERGRMLDIARKLASEMGCQINVEDMPGEYIIWLYGSRRQIGALMRELAPRG